MGQILPTPCDSSLVERRTGPGVVAACATMQGLRTSHEDAHIMLTGDDNWTVLAVLDGHGGQEAAEFMREHLGKHVARALTNKEANGSTSDVEEPRPAPSIEDELNAPPPNQEEISHNGAVSAILMRRQMCAQKGVAFAPPGDAIAVKVKRAFVDSDEACRKVMENDSGVTSGTTATLAAVRPNEDGKTFQVRLFNAGDSRCIVVSTKTRQVVVATRDHKPECPRERARIKEAGGFVSEAGVGPSRVDGTLAVSRALGDFQQKSAGAVPIAQKVCPVPDAYEVTAEEGDLVIAGCDGVFDVMTSEELVEYILKRMDETPEQAAEAERLGWEQIANDKTSGAEPQNSSLVAPREGQTMPFTSVIDAQTGKPELGRIADRVLRQCLEYSSQDNMSLLISRLDSSQKEAVEHKPPEMVPGSALNPSLPQITHDVLMRFHVSNGFPGELPDSCCVCGSIYTRMWVCRCRQATYCSQACQRLGWKAGHKQVCTGGKQ